MGRKIRPAREKAVLRYPSHWLKPHDFVSFIEWKLFSRQWDQLGLTDEDFSALQVVITACPKGGAVIQGTGGLRKGRFSVPSWQKGKRGALRICYLFVEEVGIVVLAMVYSKNEKDTLTDDEKGLLKRQIDRVKKSLLSKPYRCNQKESPEVT